MSVLQRVAAIVVESTSAANAGVEMRDAQVQTENEGIDDAGSLALAIPAAARSDDPVIFFTLYGDCYHKGRDCPGLNPRRYELQTRRLCRICERRG